MKLTRLIHYILCLLPLLAIVMDELQKMVERLTDRWELFMENLVSPAALDLFQARGLSAHEVCPRGMRGSRKGLEMQVDVFVVDDDRMEAVAIEVKSHLTQEYVDDFLSKLPNFKTLFPAYRNYTISFTYDLFLRSSFCHRNPRQ